MADGDNPDAPYLTQALTPKDATPSALMQIMSKRADEVTRSEFERAVIEAIESAVPLENLRGHIKQLVDITLAKPHFLSSAFIAQLNMHDNKTSDDISPPNRALALQTLFKVISENHQRDPITPVSSLPVFQSSQSLLVAKPSKPLPDPIIEKMKWEVGPLARAFYSLMAQQPTARLARYHEQQRRNREDRDAGYLSLNQKILSWMHADTPQQQTEQRAKVQEILHKEPNLQPRAFATLEPFAVSGTKEQAQMAWNFVLEVTGKTPPIILEKLLHDLPDDETVKDWGAPHRLRTYYWNILADQGLQRAPRSIEKQVKATNKIVFGFDVLAVINIGRSREKKKFMHSELHDPNEMIAHDFAVTRNITKPAAAPQRERASPAAPFYMMPHL